MSRLIFGVIAVVVTGCFSPRTHYYSLAPIELTQPIRVSGLPLQISHVSIPAVLDRESLVEWTRTGELKMSDTNRWAAPLDEMIRDVLAADLRHKLPGLVLLPGDPIETGETRVIVVNVMHFAPDDSQRVVMLADWSLMSGQPAEPILTRSETIKLPISSDQSSEVVPTMSEAVAILSDRIAYAIHAENPSNVSGSVLNMPS
ncbi:MAG: membrane integrity-associated transporter subunit PqiC [Deltaproteobacteria bacterium]|nr:membrane integrity-associated transporter subunit PqiC [Deltaproteobacteria bacterium]